MNQWGRGHVPKRLLTDPDRVPVKICQVCMDLPHRRAPVCPGCKLPHEEEAPLTIDEILARAR